MNGSITFKRSPTFIVSWPTIAENGIDVNDMVNSHLINLVELVKYGSFN